MSAFKVVLSFCLLIFLIKDGLCRGASLKNATALKNRLFKDYDKLLRPVNDTGNTTHVFLCVHPRHIVELDEDKSLFTLDSYLVVKWVDPRLRWNMTETGIEYAQLPISEIWKPDISLYNSHSSQVDPFREVLISVSYRGNIIWVPPATTSTFCSVTPGQERVSCEIILGSWTHDGWAINIKKLRKELHMRDFINNHPRWEVDLKTSYFVRKVHNDSCCEEPYLSMHFVLDMVRRPSVRLQAARAPCVLVALLLLGLLWVPPRECFARVAMGAALFLAMLGLAMYVSYVAKSAQEAVGKATCLISSMTVVVTIVFLLQVITTRLSHYSGPARPNAALVRWLSGPLAVRACLWSKTWTGDKVQLKNEEETGPAPGEEWALVAAALDRVVFVVCVPTLAILLLVD